MSTVWLTSNNKLVLGIIALVIVIVAVLYYYQVNIGSIAPAPVTGNAYVTLKLNIQDYFGDNESLPPKLYVAVFDTEHEPVINAEVDTSTAQNLNLDLVVPVDRPRVYIRVEVPSSVTGYWYIEYPSAVNTLAPTIISNVTVYPVNLKELIGDMKPNQEYSATLDIMTLKTSNSLTLDLPATINMSGTTPVTTTISGTLTGAEYTGYKEVEIYVKVPDNKTTIDSLTFAGTQYELEKVNDTTYKAVIGTILYGANETTKTLTVEATINATSTTITVDVFGELPDGTTVKLATDSTTINIS